MTSNNWALPRTSCGEVLWMLRDESNWFGAYEMQSVLWIVELYVGWTKGSIQGGIIVWAHLK